MSLDPTLAGKVVDSLNFNKMLAGPFMAAAKAQAALSISTMDFLNEFCLDDSGNVITTTISCVVDDPSGSIAPFDPSGSRQSARALTIPLIALLNVPALMMQKVTVKLLIEVNSMTQVDTSSANKVKAGARASAKGGFGAVKTEASVHMNTSGASSKSSKDSSSTKVVYDVYMEAENKPPKGLEMILNWIGDLKPAPDRSKRDGGTSKPLPGTE